MHRARSLRLKLTLWYMLVFTAAQVVLLAGVTVARWKTIEDSYDSKLASMAGRMVNSLLAALAPPAQTPPKWSSETLIPVVPAGSGFELAAVRDATGLILATWNVKSPEALPFAANERSESGPAGPVISMLEEEASRRLGEVDTPLAVVTLAFRWNGQRYYLQAAAPHRIVDLLRGPLYDFARFGLPIGTLAALLAAWSIAGRAVAPILRLSDAARTVSPETLSTRLSVETTDGEVRELEAELNSALARLHAGYEALERFMSDVSHELKTPIAVLLTESQVVRMGETRLVRYQEFAAEVEREMQRLGELVESFLALARASMPQSAPSEEVALNDLVLDSVRACRRLAERRGVRLVPLLSAPREDAAALELAGDSRLLRTMLDNLVRNAIRHSPRGAPVEVEVVELAGDEAAGIRVRDRGPGVPPEYLERVFDRYVRVPKADELEVGNGIGLSIARRIVELHRGSISVENEAEGGCTFSVRLPVQAPESRSDGVRDARKV